MRCDAQAPEIFISLAASFVHGLRTRFGGVIGHIELLLQAGAQSLSVTSCLGERLRYRDVAQFQSATYLNEHRCERSVSFAARVLMAGMGRNLPLASLANLRPPFHGILRENVSRQS